MLIAFNLAWATLTLICLIFATIFDIKERIVPDKVWGFQIGIGLILFVWWFSASESTDQRIMALINIILAVIFGYTFFILGSFGGGDSKAIIATSISSPIAFSDDFFNYSTPFFPSIIYILANMMLGLLFFTLLLFFTNLYQIRKFGPLFGETSGSMMAKLNVLISARRVPPDKLSNLRHEDPAEIFEDDHWKLYTPLFLEPLEDNEFEKREKEARERAKNDVEQSKRTYLWTRPQPPGILFLTFGYLIWVFFGSPLVIFLQIL